MVTKLRALHFLVITGVGGLLEWAQNDHRVFRIRALSTLIWRSWAASTWRAACQQSGFAEQRFAFGVLVESGWRAGLGYGGLIVGEGAFAIFDVDAGASVACTNPPGGRAIGPAQFRSSNGDWRFLRYPFLAVARGDFGLPIIDTQRGKCCLSLNFDVQQTGCYRPACFIWRLAHT